MSEHLTEESRALRNEVEDILRTLDPNDPAWKDDAINWGDLHVVRVERYKVGWDAYDSGPTDVEGWRVILQEAAPSCHGLPVYLSGRLVLKYGLVEVVTEW